MGVYYTINEVPDDMIEEALVARSELLEAVCELDDAMLEKYLEGETEFSPERLIKTIGKGTLDLKITPVFLGSAFKNKGIQPLLDAVVDFLPSPMDIPPVEGKDSNGKTVTREVDGPLSALAFKVMNDPYTGNLTFIRIYSGKISAGLSVVNANTCKERANRSPASECTQTSVKK